MTMSDPADETAGMVDLMASEYGWTASQVMDTPVDQIAQLMHAILNRRGVRTFRKNLTRDADAPSLADRVRGIFSRVDTTS
jgi:hypothetical protein